MKLYDTPAERELLRIVAAYPHAHAGSPDISSADLIHAARAHGVESAFASLAPIDERRALALSLSHEATRADLARINTALENANADAVLLKGFTLAERFYNPPWTRPSTDIDLLVLPKNLRAVEAALENIGCVVETGERGKFFRERHFHVHIEKKGGMPIELHFLAYRGFGHEIAAQDLFTEKIRADHLPARIFVPSPARELVYLAVHAAAHRFQRMGWLFDLKLFFAARGFVDLEAAFAFARATGFLRAFEATLTLLWLRFGVSLPRITSVPFLALRVAAEPESQVMRTLTRMIYTLSLSDDFAARARYVARALADKAMMPPSK